jgi:ABC transporter substrate binding protein
MAIHVRRRELLVTLGGAAAAWPLAASAQERVLPVIGFLGPSSFEQSAGRSLLWFKNGLAETGYAEDRNVRIEHRWADDEYERLPALAMELVQRRVTVLVAAGSPAALPAKAATSEIPVVFMRTSKNLSDLGIPTCSNLEQRLRQAWQPLPQTERSIASHNLPPIKLRQHATWVRVVGTIIATTVVPPCVHGNPCQGGPMRSFRHHPPLGPRI